MLLAFYEDGVNNYVTHYIIFCPGSSTLQDSLNALNLLPENTQSIHHVKQNHIRHTASLNNELVQHLFLFISKVLCILSSYNNFNINS